MKLQFSELFSEIDNLQKDFGDKNLNSIYGAGCINNPDLLFLFMNPTGKNVSANLNWKGLRAPWLGTKNIWKLFFKLNLLDKKIFSLTQNMKVKDWTNVFCAEIYKILAKNKIYVTNLAKCTQLDSRPLSNKVFKNYLNIIYNEIDLIRPKKIISFGNQVSSILFKKNIKISDYVGDYETITVKSKIYKVFPVYYPVGQGMRNIDKSVRIIKDLRKII